MTEPMTPEQIQQARRDAEYLVTLHEVNNTAVGRLALAFLALTEQQPEPVSRDEFAHALWGHVEDGSVGAAVSLADALLSHYTITHKPKEPTDG